MSRCGVLLALAYLSACGQISHNGDEPTPTNVETSKQPLRILSPNPTKLHALLVSDSIEVLASHKRLGFVDVYVSESQRKSILQKHAKRIIGTQTPTELFPQETNLSKYHDPQEVVSFLDQVQSNHGAIAQKVILEDTLFEGGVIYAMKISDNVTLDEDEPTFMMDMQIHAREVMTTEVALDAIDYLTSRYASDPQVQRWVDEMEIWIVPVVNPEGAARIYKGNFLWRKNRNPDCAVDLNRNFSWSYRACPGSSDLCMMDSYHGTGPNSEPETQAIHNLLDEVRPLYYINYHSFGEYILWPGGCGRIDENDLFALVGGELNQLVENDQGQTGNWTIGPAAEAIYQASGSALDQAYGTFGALAFTFELNSTSFYPNYDKWRDVTVERQRSAWQTLLRRTIDGPSVQGFVRDQVTGEPVVAHFHFVNHPFESGQNALRTDYNGFFAQATLPNSRHEILFWAEGYQSQTVVVDVGQGPNVDEVIMVRNSSENRPPAAKAGQDQDVSEGERVTLDGSGSYDPDGDALTYQWEQVSGPFVFVDNVQSPKPSFFSPGVDGNQVIVFSLLVTDGLNESIADQVAITVRDRWNNQMLFASSDTPLEIPSADPNGIRSTIVVNKNHRMLGARVHALINHDYPEDLVLRLVAPSGTEIVLEQNASRSADSLDTWYLLSQVLSQASAGSWRLQVIDSAVQDEGVLLLWELELDLAEVHEENQAPTVAISKPRNNGVVRGERVSIEVEAADADGDVDRVEFQLPDGSVVIDDQFPYSIGWDSTDFRLEWVEIGAVAFDDRGAASNQALNRIYVLNLLR